MVFKFLERFGNNSEAPKQIPNKSERSGRTGDKELVHMKEYEWNVLNAMEVSAATGAWSKHIPGVLKPGEYANVKSPEDNSDVRIGVCGNDGKGYIFTGPRSDRDKLFARLDDLGYEDRGRV